MDIFFVERDEARKKGEGKAMILKEECKTNSPLIFNFSDAIQNKMAVKVHMQAIFEVEIFDEVLTRIFNDICQKKECWGSQVTFLQSIKEILLSMDNGSNGPNNTISGLLEKVYKHETVTFENSTCYSDIGKNMSNVWNWPNPTKTGESLIETKPFTKKHNFITQDMPIGSCGSCFASEVARYLQKNNYNYVITEPNLNKDTGVHYSNAKWGVIFNTPSFRQMVERAFGVRDIQKFLWTTQTNGEIQYRDPFREEIIFDSIADYEDTYSTHIEAARKALISVKTFIFTLEVNEIWYLKSNGAIFPSCPWHFSPSLVGTKVLSVEDNVQELQNMFNVWKTFNPELQFIVAVSPIPLMSTFRGKEQHVVEASCLAKSTLRVAAEIFSTNNEDVHYFPSYEKIMYCSNNPWTEDARHVKPEAVDTVMDMFHDMFVKPQESDSSKSLTPFQHSPLGISPRIPLTKENLHKAFIGSSQLVPDYNLLAFINKNLPWSEYTNTILLNLFLDQQLTIHSIPTKRETFILWKTNHKFLFFNTKHCYEIPVTDLSDAEILQCCDCEIGGEVNHLLPPQKGETPDDYFSNELLGLKQFELLPAILKFVFGNTSLSDDSLEKFTAAHLNDLIVYQGMNDTSVASYHNLVNMFCCSNGLANDFHSSMISLFTPPKRKEVKVSLLGRMDQDHIDHVIFNLREKGYYTFDVLLPDDICNPLIDLAKRAPCRLMGDFQRNQKPVIYDENTILAPKYEVPDQLMVNHPIAQQIFLDNGVLEISKIYLKTDPYLDITTMWWSPVFSHNPDHTIAQLFHFDMDRIHWCKWFLYLTDVTMDSGPHVFVEGSHRRGKYPQALLNKGYARLQDSEILQYYPQEKIKYLTGKKGTLLVADTRGFHKGLPPVDHSRLICQFEFCSSLFGNHIDQKLKIDHFDEIDTGDYNCDIHKLLMRFR